MPPSVPRMLEQTRGEADKISAFGNHPLSDLSTELVGKGFVLTDLKGVPVNDTIVGWSVLFLEPFDADVNAKQ